MFDLPYLAKMARQFLSMPASSAGLERLFHTAGRMHDDLKSLLGRGALVYCWRCIKICNMSLRSS